MTGLAIHALGPEHLDDVLRAMAGPAFADHPAWRRGRGPSPQVDVRRLPA